MKLTHGGFIQELIQSWMVVLLRLVQVYLCRSSSEAGLRGLCRENFSQAITDWNNATPQRWTHKSQTGILERDTSTDVMYCDIHWHLNFIDLVRIFILLVHFCGAVPYSTMWGHYSVINENMALRTVFPLTNKLYFRHTVVIQLSPVTSQGNVLPPRWYLSTY